MKKNIIKIKKFQKQLMCLIVIFAILFGIAIGKFINANADEINYEYQSTNIEYDSTNNSLNATNVKEAIDELYSKVGHCPKGLECLSTENIDKINVTHSTIVKAYMYDEINEETFCVTGEEETCQKTICYLSKNKNACPSGTIIDYLVKDTTTERFHVLHDDGNTMTMQKQRNIASGIEWNKTEMNQKLGPVTAMSKLKETTDNWTNVEPIVINNDITEFEGGISTNNNCTYTSCSPADNDYGYNYSTIEGTYNARLITMQETAATGCRQTARSCPIYMYNFLLGNTEFCRVSGKCIAADTWGYWNMEGVTGSLGNALCIHYQGGMNFINTTTNTRGIRPVIVIKK